MQKERRSNEYRSIRPDHAGYSSGESFCRAQGTSNNLCASSQPNGGRNVVEESFNGGNITPQEEKNAMKSGRWFSVV